MIDALLFGKELRKEVAPWSEVFIVAALPSFPSEVGRYLAPFLCFPFYYRVVEVVRHEPFLRPSDDLVELFCLRCPLQFRLAFSFPHPKDGIVRVGVDCFRVQSLLPEECECVDDGQKFTNVVGALHGSEVEYAVACLQVDGLIFHGSWVSRAGGVHGPRVRRHFHGEWKDGVGAVTGRIQFRCIHFFKLSGFFLSSGFFPFAGVTFFRWRFFFF